MDPQQPNASKPDPATPNAEPAPFTQMQKIQDFFDEMPTRKKLILFGSIFGVLLVVGLTVGIYIASNSSQNPTTQVTTGAPITPGETAEGTPASVTGSRLPTTAIANPREVKNTPPVFGGKVQPTIAKPVPLATIPTAVIGLTANPPATNPYRYQIWQEDPEDAIGTVRIIDSSNTSKDIGENILASPGDSIYFTKDLSHMVFVGSTIEDAEFNKISFYNIAQGKIVYQISIDAMRAALPSLNATHSYGSISRMMPSPDGTKIAFSYGVTSHISQIHPDTLIIVLDLPTSRITLLNVKGLMKSWKDNGTVIYENNVVQPTLAQYPGYQYPVYSDNPNNPTKETKISNILEIR